MNQVGVIYKIINNINQKLYIGQTTNFEDRIKQHKKARSEYSLLHRAIRRHKWHNFSVIKLHENVPFKDLEWLEKYCISIYDTMSPNGYNLKYGGNRGLTNEETKRKQSEALKGEKNKNYRKDIWGCQNEIVEKYQSGLSMLFIAKKYKCSDTLIKTILLKNNVKIRNLRKLRVWNLQKEIIQKYLSGESLMKLAKTYKCSHSLIKKILAENNIKRRHRNSKN